MIMRDEDWTKSIDLFLLLYFVTRILLVISWEEFKKGKWVEKYVRMKNWNGNSRQFLRNTVTKGKARACEHYRTKASSLGLAKTFEMLVVDEKEPSYGYGRKRGVLGKTRMEEERWKIKMEREKGRLTRIWSLWTGRVKARNDKSITPADQRDCVSPKNKKEEQRQGQNSI